MVKCSSNRIYTGAVQCDFQLSKKITGFNFTFFTKNYYYWAPNVVPLILCCRLKLNNRAIKIIVHIRTLFARHHPDWKNIALCSLNIKPKGNQFETIILLTTFPPWLSLFRQKVLNLIESTLQLSLKVSIVLPKLA